MVSLSRIQAKQRCYLGLISVASSLASYLEDAGSCRELKQHGPCDDEAGADGGGGNGGEKVD